MNITYCNYIHALVHVLYVPVNKTCTLNNTIIIEYMIVTSESGFIISNKINRIDQGGVTPSVFGVAHPRIYTNLNFLTSFIKEGEFIIITLSWPRMIIIITHNIKFY